jgi:dihydroorotase
VKLYPAGATTNSDSGVTDVRRCAQALAAMQECGLPLLVHGEVTHGRVDVFDRERAFLDEVMQPLRLDFPALRVVFEHITTKDAAEYVRDATGPIAATITAHHLLFNRNALFMTAEGKAGMRPHYYCLPVLKREVHRQALLAAASSGNPRFFLGTDSAPHSRADKENACGCAGCYTAAFALELYAEAFEAAGALDRFEAFASFHGPAFYGLPRNAGTITLRRQASAVPESFPFGDQTIVPLRAGETLAWSVAS